ncbi:MAG TPA: hypothetical protein VI670_11750 [Thermoanaerobaculia bacterium]
MQLDDRLPQRHPILADDCAEVVNGAIEIVRAVGRRLAGPEHLRELVAVQGMLRRERQELEEIGGALAEGVVRQTLAVERDLQSAEEGDVERDAASIDE